MLNLYTSRPGTGSGVSDFYAWLANAAGSGSNTTGEISDALLRAGMTVEAVRQALQIVAGNVQGDPQRVAVIQDELRYLNTGGAVGVAQNSANSWALPLALVVVVYLLTRKN